jgi:hypothetical protein
MCDGTGFDLSEAAEQVDSADTCRSSALEGASASAAVSLSAMCLALDTACGLYLGDATAWT